MAITRGGVYYDLNESDFEYRFFPKPGVELMFVFSSMNHCLKFSQQVRDYIHSFNSMLRNRFEFTPELTVYPATVLYRKLETRGFKMYWNGKCFDSVMELETAMKGVLV